MSKNVLPHLMTFSALALGLFVWWQATLGFRALTWESYRRLQVEARPLDVPNVRLEDHQGQRFDMASLQDKILIVNFFYSRCTTICSVTGMVYARLQEALLQHGYQDRVSLLSISLEPQHDSPSQLKRYLQRFTNKVNGPWRAVRMTTEEDNRHLLQRLGVVSIPDGMGGIKHNAASHVIDPNGRLVRIVDESNLSQILDSIQPLLPHAG